MHMKLSVSPILLVIDEVSCCFPLAEMGLDIFFSLSAIRYKLQLLRLHNA